VDCDFEDQLTEIVAARRFAERVLGGRHARLDDVLVIVSELASNAVRHAHSGFRLSVADVEHHVRVEVVDRGPGWPEPVELTMPTNGGMGLHLVEALSDRWGAMERPGGKVVWAELDEGGPTGPS
jgi:anti-sigma regulatory factor (Ser/Thr protein kinase)